MGRGGINSPSQIISQNEHERRDSGHRELVIMLSVKCSSVTCVCRVTGVFYVASKFHLTI